MILHNVMWESRPLPKIFEDPLAALSARGSFFVLFLLWGAVVPRFGSSPVPAGDFSLGKKSWRIGAGDKRKG